MQAFTPKVAGPLHRRSFFAFLEGANVGMAPHDLAIHVDKMDRHIPYSSRFCRGIVLYGAVYQYPSLT